MKSTFIRKFRLICNYYVCAYSFRNGRTGDILCIYLLFCLQENDINEHVLSDSGQMKNPLLQNTPYNMLPRLTHMVSCKTVAESCFFSVLEFFYCQLQSANLQSYCKLIETD